MTNFRPIALCNTVAKVIAKYLATRRKNVLPTIILESQSAFVANRLITDNVLLSYEIHHLIKYKKVGREGYMSIKLGMMKAYDRIEWTFLKAMLLQLNFSHKWINLIMDYVTSVSYSVLVNGELQRISLGANTPTFSHLMFADDTLLLGRASVTEAATFMSILKQYEPWSGELINPQKSAVQFSPNVSGELRAAITDILGMPEVATHGKYLELPTSLGASKEEISSSILNRVKAKVEGWKPRLLSKVGKEIFIKSVLQVIPNYPMQCFLLPKQVCNKINSILTNYWWGVTEKKKKIHWATWKKLCTTKENGGLGFRDLRLLNLALLSKQVWRIITNPQGQLARVYKARYFLHGTFWDAQLGTKPYYTWRSLLQVREFLNRMVDWSIGDEKTIHVWHHRWTSYTWSHMPYTAKPTTNQKYTLSELIDADIGTWDIIK
ncbi:hypothetical protein LIER_39590 [Lithospermum erythrorhizon]|uniref:Reverse transcriptase domain-containing protein n=1 Tax=Lithospermum erythrorhizon TaxID=34254 RepID=A0AAV3QJU7_LITER